MSEDSIERVENMASGVSITAKVKRGSGTRDQDTMKIKAKGRTADEAIMNMTDTLAMLDAWMMDLRQVQPEVDSDE